MLSGEHHLHDPRQVKGPDPVPATHQHDVTGKSVPCPRRHTEDAPLPLAPGLVSCQVEAQDRFGADVGLQQLAQGQSRLSATYRSLACGDALQASPRRRGVGPQAAENRRRNGPRDDVALAVHGQPTLVEHKGMAVLEDRNLGDRQRSNLLHRRLVCGADSSYRAQSQRQGDA
jgi:hypothetical protein